MACKTEGRFYYSERIPLLSCPTGGREGWMRPQHIRNEYDQARCQSRSGNDSRTSGLGAFRHEDSVMKCRNSSSEMASRWTLRAPYFLDQPLSDRQSGYLFRRLLWEVGSAKTTARDYPGHKVAKTFSLTRKSGRSMCSPSTASGMESAMLRAVSSVIISWPFYF